MRLSFGVLLLTSCVLLGCAAPQEEPSTETQSSPVASEAAPSSDAPEATSEAWQPLGGTDPIPAPEAPPAAMAAETAAPEPAPSPELTAILQTATELQEEHTYVVRLHSQKHQFSMSLWKHMKNALKAVENDVIVGQATYEDWYVGKELADSFDGVGLFAHGEWADYTTEVQSKWILTDHFYVTKAGDKVPISDEVYAEALKKLAEAGRATYTVPYSNVTSTYILDKPLSEYAFVQRKPLERYFVRVRISNSSVTFSITKALRNATTASEIEFEVPKSVYDSAQEIWDPSLNVGSAILKGRLSMLHGDIVGRRTETDPRYEVATTAEGQAFVIPTKAQ